MNNKEFISALSRSLDVSLSEAQDYVNILNSSIVNLLNDKDTLSVKGFGSFEVKKRLERVVTNPAFLHLFEVKTSHSAKTDQTDFNWIHFV
mgnify:CR=1 FL=1